MAMRLLTLKVNQFQQDLRWS